MKRYILLIGLIFILLGSIMIMPALCEEVDPSVKNEIQEVLNDWFYCSISNDMEGVRKWISPEDIKLKKVLEEAVNNFLYLDLSCDPPQIQNCVSLGEDKYRVSFTIGCISSSSTSGKKEILTRQAVLKRDSDNYTWKIIEVDLTGAINNKT